MFNDSIKELIGKIFRSELLDKEVNELIQYTVKLALYSFYNINQYDQFNAAAEKALTELYQLIIADVLSLKQLDHNYLAGFISNVYDIGLLSISRMHLFYIPQISHG